MMCDTFLLVIVGFVFLFAVALTIRSMLGD